MTAVLNDSALDAYGIDLFRDNLNRRNTIRFCHIHCGENVQAA